MGNNLIILFCGLGVIFTIAFFNYFGVATTKYASAPQRSTVDTSRTVLIWIFFLTVPVKGAEEKFKWLQLLGFILLVIGTLVYNEIVVIPLLGFDQWTKAAIQRREAASGVKRSAAVKDTMDYTGTSPHAGYDAGRNQRNIKQGMEKGLLDDKDDDYDITQGN